MQSNQTMLQDSHDVSQVLTPPLAGAAGRNANINAYNSLSKPEAKDGDSYTVTLATSPAGRRPSAFDETVDDETKSRTSMARKQQPGVSKSMHFTTSMLQSAQNDVDVSLSH